MRFVAVFCHGFKSGPKKDYFRTAYRILDLSSGKYVVSYQGPVRRNVGVTPNTPPALALVQALKDPCLERFDDPKVIVCIFTTHKLIQTKVESYLMGSIPGSKFESFESIMRSAYPLLSRQRMVSIWNNVKDDSNKLRAVLKPLGNFEDESEKIEQDVFCERSILEAVQVTCEVHVTKAFERLARKSFGQIFDPT